MISNQAVAAQQDFRLIQRLFLSPGKKNSLLTFASVERGSGSSWIVSRAARVLSNHFPRHKVLVVDSNFRSPSQHRHFVIDNKTGFAQFLTDSAELSSVTRQIAGSNLYVLPSGSVSGEPYRLLLADVLQAGLEELRKQFDHILIDAPSITDYSDATLVARWSDGIILVVQADSTRHETAIRARDEVQAAQIPVLGAILNKRTFPIPESLYQKL
jgi:capsular exopolysaccharide synthesis family protein